MVVSACVWSVCSRQNESVAHAAYRLQSRNVSPTEFVEIPGRGHSLVIDSGWADVADQAAAFLARN